MYLSIYSPSKAKRDRRAAMKWKLASKRLGMN